MESKHNETDSTESESNITSSTPKTPLSSRMFRILDETSIKTDETLFRIPMKTIQVINNEKIFNTETNKKICYNYHKNFQTIPEIINTNDFKRLVVYFYNLYTNDGLNLKLMYIPGIQKQYMLPDLPFENKDLLIESKNVKVDDLTNDFNPYLVSNNDREKENSFHEDDIKIANFKNYLSFLPAIKSQNAAHWKNLPTNILHDYSFINKVNDFYNSITPKDNEFDVNVEIPKSHIVSPHLIPNSPSTLNSPLEYIIHDDLTSIQYINSIHNPPFLDPNIKSGENSPLQVKNSPLLVETTDNIFVNDKSSFPNYSGESGLPPQNSIIDMYDPDNTFNVKLLEKPILLKILVDNGVVLIGGGLIKDEKGRVFDFNRINLVPIIERLRPSGPLPETVFYLNSVAILSQRPSRILSIVPIRKQILLSAPQISSNNDNFYFQKLLKNDKLRRNNMQLPAENTLFKQFLDIATVLPSEQTDGNINVFSEGEGKCYQCGFREDVDDEETPLIPRIVGGSAATASGTPIRNRGRSGFIKISKK